MSPSAGERTIPVGQIGGIPESRGRTEPDKTAIERQISAMDKQIGRLMFEFYGLTEDRIDEEP